MTEERIAEVLIELCVRHNLVTREEILAKEQEVCIEKMLLSSINLLLA